MNRRAWKSIFGDFEKIYHARNTHWQNPAFFAYFPANSSFPSLLAEMLSSALGAQCMKWETSPAATELEEAVMIWLKKMIGLPGEFRRSDPGYRFHIHLCAILSAREKSSGFNVNHDGIEKSAGYAGILLF